MIDRANGHGNGNHTDGLHRSETQSLERTLLTLRAELLSSIDNALARIARINKETAAQAARQEQAGGSRRRSLLF